MIIEPYYRSASDNSVFKGHTNFKTLAIIIEFMWFIYFFFEDVLPKGRGVGGGPKSPLYLF